MARGRENEKVISKYEKLQGQGTFSKAIDAVNPEVSIATTSGSIKVSKFRLAIRISPYLDFGNVN